MIEKIRFIAFNYFKIYNAENVVMSGDVIIMIHFLYFLHFRLNDRVKVLLPDPLT